MATPGRGEDDRGASSLEQKPGEVALLPFLSLPGCASKCSGRAGLSKTSHFGHHLRDGRWRGRLIQLVTGCDGEVGEETDERRWRDPVMVADLWLSRVA